MQFLVVIQIEKKYINFYKKKNYFVNIIMMFASKLIRLV